MNLLFFGGDGYVGNSIKSSPLFQGLNFFTDIKNSGSFFCDVRNEIPLTLCPFKPDWIVLLAAVHREPGHEPKEYFETNIKGAICVSQYASSIGCDNIFFMSSISPYGPTQTPIDESTLLKPISPYGFSKMAAETILKSWQKESSNRRLIICRPGVIFGPKDPGNIGRTIKAVRKGYFFYPGDRKIQKSYAFIEGLLESMVFTMNHSDPLIVYNYVEQKTETLEVLCKIIAEEYSCRYPLFSIPLPILMPLAYLAQIATAGRSPLHPVRVCKAAMPTHIVPRWLIKNGFVFKWDFRAAIKEIKKNPTSIF